MIEKHLWFDSNDISLCAVSYIYVQRLILINAFDSQGAAQYRLRYRDFRIGVDIGAITLEVVALFHSGG